MVSPITRPNPSRMAEMSPDKDAGTSTLRMVWSRVAPRAKDASLKCRGTLVRASSAREKIVGMAINARRHPAVKALRRSLMGKPGTQDNQLVSESDLRDWPRIATPKKPRTTEGIAAMNSMAGLIQVFSPVPATSLT